MRYVRGLPAVLLVTLSACEIVGPEIEPIDFSAYHLQVEQGGASGVYFLQPLKQSTYTGVFDPDRNPVVHICVGAPASPCTTPVAVFDMVIDPGESLSQVLRLSPPDEHYIVNWHTRGLPVDQYRIFVLEDGAAQAYIDVVVANGVRRMRTYEDTGSRPYSGTIPIRFRMEEVVVEEPQLPTTGLAVRYFDWSNSAADFDAAAPILDRIDPVVDFRDETGDSDVFDIGRSDHIMARWTGFVVAQTTGFHTFCVVFDDGVRLFMNGVEFFSSWGEQAEATRCASTNVAEEGQRIPIVLEWFHSTGGGTVQLSWETPNTPREVVPTTALSPE